MVVNIMFLAFILIILIVFLFIFCALFFLSLFNRLWLLLHNLFYKNREDCPFCHGKRTMILYKTDDGLKEICKRCKFSIDIGDKNN